MVARVFAARTLEISASKDGPWIDLANAALSRHILCTRTYADDRQRDTIRSHGFVQGAVRETRPLGEFRIYFVGRSLPAVTLDLLDPDKRSSLMWIRYPTHGGQRYMSGWPHSPHWTLGPLFEYRLDIRLVSDDEIVQPHP